MTGFVLILAALQLAVPVRCYQTDAAWRAQTGAMGIPVVAGYYDPRQPHIGLSPAGCRAVRTPTLEGANLLAHELAHAWQHSSGGVFDEAEADRIAEWADNGLLRRLERGLGRRAPAVVRLAP